MRVIVYMLIAHVSPTHADTNAWEGVQIYTLLPIGQRLVVVQIGRPHAGDARTSRPSKQLWPYNSK